MKNYNHIVRLHMFLSTHLYNNKYIKTGSKLIYTNSMCYTLPTNNSYYTILVLHENKLNSSPEPSRGATRNKAWKETHHNKPTSSCCMHVFDLAPTQTKPIMEAENCMMHWCQTNKSDRFSLPSRCYVVGGVLLCHTHSYCMVR